MWTDKECLAVKDSDGTPIGDWDPPSGYTKGPYCYVKQPPIKLSVAVGGLTEATLAGYLAAAFKLGIGIAAVLAVIMIMVGGFRYITAAGGGGVEDAKRLIKNAVVGLLLTMLSYTLLQTVNPDILNLKLPRVQIVKPCNVSVSCASRKDPASCNNNPPESGMRCVWNQIQQICYDNSNFESDAMGENGGPCLKDSTGNWYCKKAKCIVIDSSTNGKQLCSTGGPCQACINDSDCAPQSGSPGKCDTSANNCMIADPNGNAGSYKKCTGLGGKCDPDKKDCENGFCNRYTKTCTQTGQGVLCANGDDDCDTGSGYHCLYFNEDGTQGDSTKHWKAACCLNSIANGCLGCDLESNIKGSNGKITNFQCPKPMHCGSDLRCVIE